MRRGETGGCDAMDGDGLGVDRCAQCEHRNDIARVKGAKKENVSVGRETVQMKLKSESW